MNSILWNYYKQSEDGQKAIKLFDPTPEDFDQAVTEIARFSAKWGNLLTEDLFLDWFFTYQINLYERNILEDEYDRNSFEKFVESYDIKDFSIENDEVVWQESALIMSADEFRKKAATTEALSLLLYYRDSFFKPLLIPSRFDFFQKSCDALGIELPLLPRTSKYKEYLMYYYDICKALNSFQEEYGLTDAELCACVYDYGIRVLNEKGDHSSLELPQPTNVWITGGSKGDFEFLDTLGKGEKKTSVWACNERTQKGDIVVMYCLSPRSYIHSIWRATSSGIFNPFDYYHCRIEMGDGVRLPNISLKDLKKDPYFSQLPLVRKNLQGVNGVEFSAQTYSELIRLAEEKGGNRSKYPELFVGQAVDFGIINKEKDVEEHILIPILNRLGYKEEDWIRQLQLKAGRKEKAIPDFVFLPSGSKHFESAPLVIEAKLDITSMVEMQRAFRQTLSYARMLRSKIMGICDKEKLILYSVDNTGSCRIDAPIFENHWQTIYTDNIVGAELNKLIGANIVRNL